MNIVLFDGGERLHDNRVTLKDHRARHIFSILKLSVGDSLRIGELGGKTGIGKIYLSSPDEVSFQIEELATEPPPPSPVELILGLPRPKSLKRCFRAIANLGIKSVHLIHSVRVDKSYWSAPALEPPVMRQSFIDGLSIARDTIIPEVRLHRLFKPFAQEVAPHLIKTEAFVAHPSRVAGDHALAQHSPFINACYGRIPVAIGPEGGFIDYEVALMNEAGFKNLSLGNRLYSVECAVPLIESLIRLRSLIE